MKIYSIILAMLFCMTTAKAQLCGPDNNQEVKGGTITFPSVSFAVDLGGDLRTVIEGKFVSEKKLISQLEFKYTALSCFKKMVESIKLSVHFYKAPRPSLCGNTPAKEETKIYQVMFHPVDDKMVHFEGALDMSTNGWDKIDVEFITNSDKIILKSEYNPLLIKEK